EAANRAVLEGSLRISAALGVDGDVTAGGSLNAKGGIATDGGLTVNGAASVAGDASVAGNLTLTGPGNVTLRRALVVMGTTDTSKARRGEVVGALGFLGSNVQHAQLAFRAGSGFELVDMSASGPQIG